MKINMRIFQNFSFWKINHKFNGKTGLLDSFSKAFSKTNRVLEKAHLSGRGASALLLLTAIYFCTAPALVFASGKKDQPKKQLRPEARILVSTEPSVKPAWVDVVPQSDTEIFFVGSSQIFNTPANARDNARESARIQVLEYYGQVIEKQAISLSTVTGSTRDTLAPYVVREEEIKTFAQNVVSEVATKEYYTEIYLNSNNKEEYIVYTLHNINRKKAEDEISNFAKNISARYTAALSQWNTLKAALEGYAFIVKSLERNPLHRIMAYYETPKGKAGLYEYARLQINELANSVSVEAIPARTVQETETLTTPVKLRSSIMPSTGLLDCQASIYGIGGGASYGGDDITYPFKSASDTPYNLQIRNIKPGAYNVSIAILLSDMTGGIAKNTSGNFSFEVTPLNVMLDTPAAIEAGIKKAVDTLAARLPGSTETVIGVFTLAGTNIPSELSLFLTEKVTHYAKNNQGRKYKIIEEAGNRTVLNGFFRKQNDRVNVTLELSTPGKDADGSQIFSLSLAALEQMGIAVEPENIKTMIVLDEVVPVPVKETIHIKAVFNSNTRTYKHRDELKLTVSADLDCYFKIIHIDVDNKIKMIYPTSRNDDNRLRANVSRTVFDSQNRYVLYGPYGAETIVVAASPVQFPGIDAEYGRPWKAATEEAIKKAIAGEGEARYPITILKPHEEYEYTKPENMTEMYQSIRDDAIKQGGYFEGGAVSGFYIINNVRGSYRVQNDTIQFASYFLDAYTADSYRGSKTRGAPFNFSFVKPQNISQALQAVRGGIESKGGTFTGNEQQGNFKANGIAGQYRVSDMVNVTILEKPLVVPNSLIVNEVKNYFGVK